MKKILGTVTLAVMAVLACTTPAQSKDNIVPDKPVLLQGGPGIVVAASADISELPDSAQLFLNKHYEGVEVTECSRNFVKDASKVTLADGTKIEFNGEGQVKDITSGHNVALGISVLSDILPEKTVEHLEEAGVADEVSAIKNARDRGWCVMLLNSTPPQMIFDVYGVFVFTAG